MNCQQVRKLWNDGIDGRVDPASRDQVNGHFDSCLECRRYKAQMAGLIGALDYLRSQSEQRPMQSRPVISSWVKIAAGILIVIGTTLFLATNHQTHKPANTLVAIGQALSPVPQTTIKLKQESAKTLLAVQYKTDNPRVHLFVLYPLARAPSVEKKIN